MVRRLIEAPDLTKQIVTEEAKEASERDLAELMSLLRDLLSNRLDSEKSVKKLQDAIQKVNVYVKTLTTQVSQTESRLSDYVSGPKVTVEELIGVRKDIEGLTKDLHGVSDQLINVNSKIKEIETTDASNGDKWQDTTELKTDLEKLTNELEKVKKALEFVGRSGGGELHFIDRHSRKHTVTDTADHTFSSGTANFLRADGAWAAPPGGAGGTPSDTVLSESTLAGSASAAGTSTEYSRGDHTHGTPQITDFLEGTPTNGEVAKAPTSDWAFDHNAAVSGVHGAGTATLATTANITTHAALTTVHSLNTMAAASSADYVALAAYTAKGALLAGSAASAPAVLAVGGTAGHVLTVDSAEPTGMKWAAAGAGTPSGTAVSETTLAGSAVAAGTSSEYSRGDHTHGTPQITNYLESSPTNGETAKAPNSDWAFDHNAAGSGVHGSGTATLATTADITTHAGAANPHTVYLLKQMAENDPLLLDAALSGTGTYSGLAEAGTANAALSFGQLIYLLAGSSRWELAVGDTTVAAKNKLGICVAAATGAAATTTILLIGKVSASVFPSLTVGAPVFISSTAGSVVVTASTAGSTITRIVGYGNATGELYFKPDNTFVELA